MARIIDKRKLKLLLFIFVIHTAATPLISMGENTLFLESSISARMPEIKELVAQCEKYQVKYSYYNENRQEILKKVQEWKYNSIRGFTIDNFSVFYSKDFEGCNILGAGGLPEYQFSLSNQKNARWMSFGKLDGNKMTRPKLTVGYKDGKPHMVDIVLKDGTNYQYWEKGYKVIYSAGVDYYYMLMYLRSEPMLTVGPKLCELIFYAKHRSADQKRILDDIFADFPNTYFSRILRAALESGTEIHNEKDLALYSANWFRKKIGLKPIDYSDRLERAAKNHAHYIIINDLAKMMHKWDQSRDINECLSVHYEQKGRQGFTGFSPSDRTRYTGYGENASECGSFSRYNVIDDMCSWAHTIFHRRPIVDIRVNTFGIGHESDRNDKSISTAVTNWGYDDNVQFDGYCLYPAHRDECVPYAWSGLEAPNPFPGLSHGMGVPITLSFKSYLYKGGILKLYDSAGKEVACLKSKTMYEPDYFLEIVPEYPLKPGSEYTIVFSFGNVKKKSSFRTFSLNPAELAMNELISTFSVNTIIQK